jgi:predicted ATPase
VEDLHWVDPSTLEWLTLLLDQTPTAPILIVLTCRLDFQSPWGQRAHLTSIVLPRLSPPHIQTMIACLTGEQPLPPAVLEHLVVKTDGVPLFVEELTKMVLEAGFLSAVHDRYELTRTLPPLAIPASLHDALLARLDRLAAVKGLAQLGAVLGRHFPYALLQAVVDLDESTLQRALEQLVAAELLYQQGVPPQATYVFKHALIQDTAYQSLLRSTRQQYHQRTVQVLAEQFPEIAATQPELLAHHYTEAGLSLQALRSWQQAGQHAVERLAYTEAIAHLTKGLEVVQTLPDPLERAQHEITLQLALGDAVTATKGYAAPEVGRAYAQAWARCQQLPESPQLCPALFNLWKFYSLRAEWHTCRVLAEHLLTLAQQQQQVFSLMQAHFALGETLLCLGHPVAAQPHLVHSIRLSSSHEAHAWAEAVGMRVSGLVYAAWTLWHLGYAEQAVQHTQEALRLVRELSHPFTLAFVQAQSLMLLQFRRDWRAAEAEAEALITLAMEHDFPFWLAYGTLQRGCVLAAQEHTEAGIAQLRQGLSAWQSLGTEAGMTYWRTALAVAYGHVGQTEEAHRLLREAREWMDKTGEGYWAAEVHRLTGTVLLQHAVLDEAQAAVCFQQALDVARHQQAKSLELRAAMSLARLWQSQGKGPEASELLAPVYGWFTEGFDTADLQEAKTLLEELAG